MGPHVRFTLSHRSHLSKLIFVVEIRGKAIDVALSLSSGAYQTSLVSYFTHRDLFPALMKVLLSLPSYDIINTTSYSFFLVFIIMTFSPICNLHISDSN